VASTAAPIGPTMLIYFPEVEDFTRINSWGETILKTRPKVLPKLPLLRPILHFLISFPFPFLWETQRKHWLRTTA